MGLGRQFGNSSYRLLVLAPLLFVFAGFQMTALGADGASSGKPVSGKAMAQMSEFDKESLAILDNYQIPGAVLTVAYKGKIVFSRGYGFADKEKKLQMQPDAVFRIASLTKPMTAVGILSLCQKANSSWTKKPSLC